MELYETLYFDEKELLEDWSQINKIHTRSDDNKNNLIVELKGRLSKEEYIKKIKNIKTESKLETPMN